MESEQNTENFTPNVQSTPNETNETRPSIGREVSVLRVSFSDEKLESSSNLDVRPFDPPSAQDISVSNQPSMLELSDSNPDAQQSSVPKSFIRSSAMVSTPRASLTGATPKRHTNYESTQSTAQNFQEVSKKLELIDSHLKQKKDQTHSLELLIQELSSLMLDQAPLAKGRHSMRKSLSRSVKLDPAKKLPKILHSLCSRIIAVGIEDLDFEELRYFHEEIYHAATKLVNAQNPEARMLNEVTNMRQQIDMLNNEIQKVRCALQCPRKNCPRK